RRELFEIPADSALVVGAMMMGSRHVADPAVVTRYFGAVQKLWLAMVAVPTAGTATLDFKLQTVPPPPADLILVAMKDQLDYRAREASDDQHRHFMAEMLGRMAGTEFLGTGVKLAMEKPTPLAAVLVLGVLAGSWYVDRDVTALSDWSFAWADEFALENGVTEAFYEVSQSYQPKSKSWLPDFMLPRYKTVTKFEAVRGLADAVLRLEAHRDLPLLLAEMNVEDKLDASDRKFQKTHDPRQKQQDDAQAFAEYRVRLRQLVDGRKG